MTKNDTYGLWALPALAILSTLAAGPALAATLAATPTNVETILDNAKGGDTVVLSKGVYTEIRVYSHNPASAVTIDARAATILNMPFSNSSNFTLLGGAFGPSTYSAVTFVNSHNITLQGGAFTRPGTSGVAITTSQHINVVGIVVTGSSGDGIDITASQYVLVQGNTCLDNIRTAIHPDCVQMWSVIGEPPISHITITGNRARGSMQGFDMFDHGTGGGSYIDIDHNVICTTYTWAGQVNAATNSSMTYNTAYTLPGAVVGWAPPTWQINLATIGMVGGGGGGGTIATGSSNVFADNVNGTTPNTKGIYPPCPV